MSVVVQRSAPVSTFRAVTVAKGITAPLVSVTVPDMTADTCVCTDKARINTERNLNATAPLNVLQNVMYKQQHQFKMTSAGGEDWVPKYRIVSRPFEASGASVSPNS